MNTSSSNSGIKDVVAHDDVRKIRYRLDLDIVVLAKPSLRTKTGGAEVAERFARESEGRGPLEGCA